MAVHARGQVSRIYTTGGYTYYRLAGLPANLTPKNHYFRLAQTHSNYNALYSLALVAAVNRYRLWIRTNTDIDPNQIATVRYMVVDW